MASLREIIKAQEGFSEKLYKCPAGKWTIGWGYNIEDRGLPRDILEDLLSRDISRCERFLVYSFPWFLNLDQARQKALICMVYQLGESGFAKFTHMIAALRTGDYAKAAKEALNSNWAKQTPQRALKVANTIRTGKESLV